MIKIHTQTATGQAWLDRFQGRRPTFVCVLGFTATGLIPGISAAGATPQDRKHTAIADAEFLCNGPQPHPVHPLPPLHAGASPVLITRAVVTGQNLPAHILNAGLPYALTVPHIDLGGSAARCLSQGNALDLAGVHHLFEQGLAWGERLAEQAQPGYVVVGECVVGGTTTALAVLTGLGWNATGKVNSSHPTCNHQQKWEVVTAGLEHLAIKKSGSMEKPEPFHVISGVGDPMQPVVAGLAIAASRRTGVMLAGGTQMLAVYALIQRIATTHNLSWNPDQIVVGTTRWVAEDPSGNTVGLAQDVRATLLATQLSFASSRHAQLHAYEQGYVKEGVGAGGCAIAAHLYQNWGQERLMMAIEALADELERTQTWPLNPSLNSTC